MARKIITTIIKFISYSYNQATGEHRLILDAGDGRRVYTAFQEAGTSFEIYNLHGFTLEGRSAAAWEEIAQMAMRLAEVYHKPTLIPADRGNTGARWELLTSMECEALDYFSRRLDEKVASLSTSQP